MKLEWLSFTRNAMVDYIILPNFSPFPVSMPFAMRPKSVRTFRISTCSSSSFFLAAVGHQLSLRAPPLLSLSMKFSIKGLSGSLKLKDLASCFKKLTVQNNLFFFRGSFPLDLNLGHPDSPASLMVVTEANPEGLLKAECLSVSPIRVSAWMEVVCI